MGKDILFEKEARQKLLKGINKMSDAVKVTLGAAGRNVIIKDQYGNPYITKDGVSVAKSIFFDDDIENIGASIVKEVSLKVNDIVGDNTTTATVLAQAIVNKAMEAIDKGSNPVKIKMGIDEATKLIIDKLTKNSTPIKQEIAPLTDVASISANNDRELGAVIASAFERVGLDGAVTVKESNSSETTIEFVNGYSFDSGLSSPYFVNNTSKLTAEYEDAKIIIYDGEIQDFKDFIHYIEPCVNNKQPLIVLAKKIEGEALSTLVYNKVKQGISLLGIDAPMFSGDPSGILEDIAAISGATIMSDKTGNLISEFSESNYGELSYISCSKTSTTIIGNSGNKDRVDKRVEYLRNEIEEGQNQNFNLKSHKERIARLIGGVAIIYVGASSDVELREKKDRVDDSVYSTKAALEKGISAGGGIALLNAIKSVSAKHIKDADVALGFNTVIESCKQPFLTIVSNAGFDSNEIYSQVSTRNRNFGMDVKDGKIKNMIKAGIIDPTKSTITALEKASSVSGTLITTEAVVYDVEKE